MKPIRSLTAINVRFLDGPLDDEELSVDEAPDYVWHREPDDEESDLLAWGGEEVIRTRLGPSNSFHLYRHERVVRAGSWNADPVHIYRHAEQRQQITVTGPHETLQLDTP